MKCCVVTGAGGLLGSHLVPALAHDWEVHAVSRHRPAGLDGPNVVWHPLDLSRRFDPSELPERADAVVYLAQSEHFREFPERALDIFEVNTVSLLRFLDYARRSGVRSFVFASSGGVYGSADTSLNEDLPVLVEGDLGFYLGSKLCSEIVALNYAKLMNVTILRFFFVYGPGQRKTMLIPRLIESVKSARPIVLQGADGIRLNPTYVGDAASAVCRALELESGHIINVAGGEVFCLRELVELIGARIGRRPVFDVRLQEVPRHLVADTRKKRELIGPPQVPLAEGLNLMLQAEGVK